MITEPMPFKEAIGFLADKEQLPAEWNAAEWAAHEPEFRSRAFFSAKVENARFLDRAHSLLFDYIAGVKETVTNPDGVKSEALSVFDRAHFVRKMREFMVAEGMATKQEFFDTNQKDITDIKSEARLRLIFDTNVRQAYGYGQWKQGMTPATAKDFPAARLVRVRGVNEPRPRHQDNLGEVLLKTDPRWAEFHNAKDIGGFGVPWGPYGFHSGVTQEDVSKEEAARLGLMGDKSAEVAPMPKFNGDLWASVRNMDPDIKAALIKELQSAPKPRSPQEAAREAVAKVRTAQLAQGMQDATDRGQAGKAEKYRKALAELDAKLSPAQGLAVREEVGKIILNEGIHERLAKVMDQGGPLAEQQAAIAQKVFEMVDRKAAEPQLIAETQKGAPRARHLLANELILTPEERLIIKSPHEILLIHDADGRLKSARLGTAREVTIPLGTADDAILSHNHPSGRGPSDSDIKSALANPGRTLRIVTVNENSKIEIFQIQALSGISDVEIQGIGTLYKEESERGGDTPHSRREALALILDIYEGTLAVASRIFL